MIWQYRGTARQVKSMLLGHIRTILFFKGRQFADPDFFEHAAYSAEQVFDMYNKPIATRGFSCLGVETRDFSNVLPAACDHCGTGMSIFYKEHEHGCAFGGIPGCRIHFVCQDCGWWATIETSSTLTDEEAISLDPDSHPEYEGPFNSRYLRRVSSQAAILKELDLRDISLPVIEVRDYLRLRYEERFNIHPRKYEEVVASVFSDLGYLVELTRFSKDGGIDCFLVDSQGSLIGVQVKRYKDKIGVSQIREFLGALVVAGVTKGIFITTSKFTSSSADVVKGIGDSGKAYIDLVGDNAFFDALKISQRPKWSDFFDTDRFCFLDNFETEGLLEDVMKGSG